MAKVIVGMSGGVDSAVAAYLLKKQGYEVIGVTLRTWTSQEGEESRCCEIDDARRIADRIGIGYRTLNCEQAFRQSVIEPFVQEYVSGKTPNPCVICNRRVKWEWMTYLAGVLQADYVATGHYASIVQLENGRYTVKRASSKKDQAYMLYRLSQEQLSRTLLPLSDLTKDGRRRSCRSRTRRIPRRSVLYRTMITRSSSSRKKGRKRQSPGTSSTRTGISSARITGSSITRSASASASASRSDTLSS